MESRWNSFRKEVQGFLKLRPYQRDATFSPAVVIHRSPVPLTGASLTSFSEELCILRQELKEQDSLIAECDISDEAIHDIKRRLTAVVSTPPPYSFQDTWYLSNCRDAELRKIEGLIVKMQGLVVKLKPLTQRRRVLSKQVSVGVVMQTVDTEWLTYIDF